MKLLINKIPIDYEGKQSYYFFNPKHPKAEDFKKRATQLPVLKSHIYLYTSGHSKICLLSKKALLHQASLANKNLQASKKDKWLISLPLYHVGGISILARAFLSKSSYLINTKKWYPLSFKKQIEKEKISLSSLVPTQVYDLVAKNLKAPPCLRALLVGGDFLSPEIYKQAKELGWPLLLCYGATETSSHIAVEELSSLKKARKGKAFMKLLEGVELYPDKKSVSVEGNKKSTALKNNKKKRKELALKKETGKKQAGGASFFKVKSPGLLTAYFDLKKGRLFDPKDKDGLFLLEDPFIVKNKTLELLAHLSPQMKSEIKILGEKVNLKSLVCLLENSKKTIKKELEAQKNKKMKDFKAHLIPIPEERQSWILALVGEIKDFDKLLLLKKNYNKKVLPYEKIQALYFLEKDPLQSFLKLKLENWKEWLALS